ncbi:hypothetical protein [Flavobacterium sp. CF136]|uniref:hypothetical protein n=1 Tax=Flavobacterium sp. (strain CF136) TaxID=1144313 RepID=UPI0002717CB5|nr:hypothetical protein [Flavobacterium sp. CF136]EJL61697.1 hypothetical protein PMI10_03219 [Flavobacterium sp. CF136]
MDSEKLRDIIIPLIVIGAGLFIKTTENKNYQDVKKWGKYLIIIGIASLIIRNIDLLIN